MAMHEDFDKLRKEYTVAGLMEQDCGNDPIALFGQWLLEAIRKNVTEPNAMVLATATKHGVPSSRMVLLKDVDHDGFTFFTNYESRKGMELEQNHNASLLFFWAELERQIRIEGSVSKLSRSDSENYFRLRPRGSQLSTWVSRQSKVVASRATLVEQMEKLSRQFGDDEIPTPPHWGGYCLQAHTIEFWQGRPDRLHDRLRFSLEAEQFWKLERLSP
ncbi:MAG: pyridoxamine 5'-phosphate oxidase [Ignavibacteriales bacterium]|nr:pyridoxamine 5'-phosphate oxidase [Ignavibacteriales bacterium]